MAGVVPVGFGGPIVAVPARGSVVVCGIEADEEEGDAGVEFATDVGGDEAGGW